MGHSDEDEIKPDKLGIDISEFSGKSVRGVWDITASREAFREAGKTRRGNDAPFERPYLPSSLCDDDPEVE